MGMETAQKSNIAKFRSFAVGLTKTTTKFSEQRNPTILYGDTIVSKKEKFHSFAIGATKTTSLFAEQENSRIKYLGCP